MTRSFPACFHGVHRSLRFCSSSHTRHPMRPTRYYLGRHGCCSKANRVRHSSCDPHGRPPSVCVSPCSRLLPFSPLMFASCVTSEIVRPVGGTSPAPCALSRNIFLVPLRSWPWAATCRGLVAVWAPCRYGEDAGKLAHEAGDVGKGLMAATLNMKRVGIKPLLKLTARDAGTCTAVWLATPA